MRVGYVLSDAEIAAGPSAIEQAARSAETLGFDSLWIMGSDLFPAHNPALNQVYDGALPRQGEPIQCPLQALALAARATQHLTLGISLPNVPFYSPVAVAGSLATLDVLSRGRLQLGLGLGSTVDEFGYVAGSLARPDTPAAEFLRTLDQLWSCDAAGFSGEYYVIPRQHSCLTPVQRPHLPVRLTAFAPAAVQRPAMLLRGGSPVRMPSVSANALFGLRSVAVDRFGLVVRALVQLSESPLGPDRAIFSGTASQIRADMFAAAQSGATELLLDLSQSQGADLGSLALDLDGLRALAQEPMTVAA